MRVVVSEVFGPTFQGEGPLTGRRCSFVRFGRCDLSCAWCDTPYTWDWGRYDPKTELEVTTTGDVFHRVVKHRTDGVVITGGEPLLQRKAVVDLCERAMDRAWWVQIETNGLHPPPVGLPAGTMIVASPKLSGSGMPRERAIRVDSLSALVDWGAHFKFVVTGQADVDEAGALVAEVGIPGSRVWLMPEGKTADWVESGLPAVADEALRLGWNLSGRMHVAIWGDRRAV